MTPRDLAEIVDRVHTDDPVPAQMLGEALLAGLRENA